MKILLLAAATTMMISCTSNEHEVKNIDTTLESTQKTEDGQIGIDKEGDAVMQSKKTAQEELRQQEWVNSRLEDDLENDHHALKTCRNDQADPRLGGNGRPRDIPEIDDMKETSDVKEQFGLDEKGKMQVVKREYYLDRLKRERKYEKSLRKMIKIVKKNREECQMILGQSRVKSGLPSKKYLAKGYYDDKGKWVETRKAENTLDDAFDIMNMEKAK